MKVNTSHSSLKNKYYFANLYFILTKENPKTKLFISLKKTLNRILKNEFIAYGFKKIKPLKGETNRIHREQHLSRTDIPFKTQKAPYKNV